MKLSIAALAILASCGSPAFAQAKCGKTQVIYKILYEKHGEQRISIGALPDGSAIEFWGGLESGTWTVFVTKGLVSCLIANGDGWHTEPPIYGDPA